MSALALLKIAMHARSGGSIEVSSSNSSSSREGGREGGRGKSVGSSNNMDGGIKADDSNSRNNAASEHSKGNSGDDAACFKQQKASDDIEETSVHQLHG